MHVASRYCFHLLTFGMKLLEAKVYIDLLDPIFQLGLFLEVDYGCFLKSKDVGFIHQGKL